MERILKFFGIETEAMRRKRVAEMQAALDFEHNGDGYDYIPKTQIPRSAGHDYNYKITKDYYRDLWNDAYSRGELFIRTIR